MMMLCIIISPKYSVSPKPALVDQSDAHPTGDQEVAGSTPIGSVTFFLWR